MDLFESLKNILSMGNDQYAPLAAVSEDQKKEWNELKELSNRCKKLMAEHEAKKDLFWANIQKKLNMYGENLMYDEKTDMIMIKKEKKE
jgi:hypothetical protein